MTHDERLCTLLRILALVATLALAGTAVLAQDVEPEQRDADATAAVGAPSPETADESGDETAADEGGAESTLIPDPEDAAEPEDMVVKTTRRGEMVRLFADLVVSEDQVIRGDVVCVGCDAVVKGRITGELVVVMGSLDLSGTVEGGAVVVMSDAIYRETASVGRELVHVMGDLDDRGADLPLDGVRMELFGSLTSMVLWFATGELLVMLVVFVLIALIAPRRVVGMSEDAVRRYGVALLIGFLIHLGVLIVNVTLIFTVIGIPIAILIDLAFRMLRMFGRAALLHACGRSLGRSFDRSLSVLASVLLGFFGFALVSLLPLFFGLPGLLVACLVSFLLLVILDFPAIGVVTISRLGDARPGGGAASSNAPAAPEAPPATP